MGTVGVQAWLSALALVTGGTQAFAQGEPRQADPVSVRLLTDLTGETVQPGGPGSRFDNGPTATLKGRLYFFTGPRAAEPARPAPELWVTDGTRAGTRSAQDLLPANLVMDESSLRATSQRLFFTATDANTGRELWTSDGTPAGTHLVRELQPGPGSAFDSPGALFVSGDTVLFTASDGASGFELWKSDGTEVGTVRVKDVLPGTGSSLPGELTRVGDTVFFSATGPEGRELWRTDGTEAGTRLVRDLREGTGDASPGALTAVGSTLFFVADDGLRGPALWKSDGTQMGTAFVTDLGPGATSPSRMRFAALGNTLLFLVEGQDGAALWRTDGTESGSLPVKALPGAMTLDSSRKLVAVSGRAYFSARGANFNDALWVTDGTAEGTRTLPLDFPQGRVSLDALTEWDGALAFTVAVDNGVRELWRTDGTGAGTLRLTRLPSGNPGFAPKRLSHFQGSLVVASADAWTHLGLWRLDRDDAPPTFVCPAAEDVPSNSPEGTRARDLVPSLVGGQPPFTVRSTHPDGTLLPLYQPIPIHYQAEDAEGRVASCAITTTSRDVSGPTFQGCPAGLTLDTRSARGLTFHYPNVAVTDETSPEPLISYSPENGSVLPLGDTVVTMTAKDRAGNASTCTFTVTVRDALAPSSACKVSEVRVEAEGPEGAHAFWPEDTSTDGASSQVTVTRTHASGDLFPLGLTRVQLTRTDAAGTRSTCEIQVKVRDSRPPLLTCPRDLTLKTAVVSGTRADYPPATAEDTVSATDIAYSPAVGTPLAPGLHSVQVTAIDAAGNAALCGFHLTVEYDPTSDMRQGLGCSVGNGPSAAGWGAVLFLAWTWSRRRRDGTPRA